MAELRFYLRFHETGGRVLHEDGYVYAFDTIEDAAASARGLRETYGVETYIQEIRCSHSKLPLTPAEWWLLKAVPQGVLPGLPPARTEVVVEEKQAVVLGARRIRIRKGK